MPVEERQEKRAGERDDAGNSPRREDVRGEWERRVDVGPRAENAPEHADPDAGAKRAGGQFLPQLRTVLTDGLEDRALREDERDRGRLENVARDHDSAGGTLREPREDAR